jgi:hypothetical protein
MQPQAFGGGGLRLASSFLVASLLAVGCDASHGQDGAAVRALAYPAEKSPSAESTSPAPDLTDDAETRIEVYLSCIDFDCASALRAVVASGAHAIPRLLEILRTHPTDVADPAALRAVAALGEIGDARAIPVIRALLSAENPLLRAEAVRALGRLRDGGDISVLAARLDDPDPLVREAAVGAVASADRRAAGAILRAALDREQSPHIVAAIRRALQDLGGSDPP